MVDTQGPLDLLPERNYPPSLSQANYWATKQLINQVISEDQDYVTWKLKDVRTGGTMNGYLNEFMSGNFGQHQFDDDENYEMDGTFGKISAPKSSVSKESQASTRKGGKVTKATHINSVPKNLTFPRDIYEAQIASLPQPRQLDQSEQLNLLLTNLDEEQMNRFEVFRRTSLAKNNIKKISGIITNQTVAANINLLLAGVGKIFIGEIVEKAQEVKQRKLVALMASRFREKKIAAHKLKKTLKKLTLAVENSNNTYDDSVDENESDVCEDDDDEDQVSEVNAYNDLVRSNVNTEVSRLSFIRRYNKLVKSFNSLDVSVEKFANCPLLPEHIREAWRLYRAENDTVPQATWRTQGEGNGEMFR